MYSCRFHFPSEPYTTNVEWFVHEINVICEWNPLTHLRTNRLSEIWNGKWGQKLNKPCFHLFLKVLFVFKFTYILLFSLYVICALTTIFWAVATYIFLDLCIFVWKNFHEQLSVWNLETVECPFRKLPQKNVANDMQAQWKS